MFTALTSTHRVHGLCTRVYGCIYGHVRPCLRQCAVQTADYAVVDTCTQLVHGRRHGPYTSCTRPPTHDRIYGRIHGPCTRPVHGCVRSCVHGPCTRVHYRIHGSVQAVYMVVFMCSRHVFTTRTQPWNCHLGAALLHAWKQELIRRWDSERELLYDDNIHVEASAYSHW